MESAYGTVKAITLAVHPPCNAKWPQAVSSVQSSPFSPFGDPDPEIRSNKSSKSLQDKPHVKCALYSSVAGPHSMSSISFSSSELSLPWI